MSKVQNLNAPDVIDYCANQKCESEILFGQIAVKHGKELYCNLGCMAKAFGAVTISADDQERR